MPLKCERYISKLILLTILFILFTSHDLFSKPIQLKFKKLPGIESVALNLTKVMLQDSKGFLWFGTVLGLVRYDGINYNIYYNINGDSTSISSDNISTLFEDSDNQIWIGTKGGGLNKYNSSKNDFIRYYLQPLSGDNLPNYIISAIAEDKNKNLWIAGEEGNIDLLNIRTGKSTTYENNLSTLSKNKVNKITSLLCDSNGNIVIGASTGLYLFELKGNKFFSLNELFFTDGHGTSPYVTSLFQDSQDNIWICTTTGLFLLDKNYSVSRLLRERNELFANFSKIKINTIFQDKKRYFWIGTSEGLSLVSPDLILIGNYRHDRNKKQSISSDDIYSITQTIDGCILVSSYNGWIDKVEKANFLNYRTELISNNDFNLRITAIEKSGDGILWFGTAGGTVIRYDKRKKSLKKFKLNDLGYINKTNPGINSIKTLSGNELLLGTNSGLIVLDVRGNDITIKRKQYLEKFKNIHITSIIVENENTIWVATYGDGIFKINPVTNSVARILYMNSPELQHLNFITTICLTHDDTLWVGTIAGLFSFDPYRKEITEKISIIDKSSLSNNYILCLTEDYKNNLWVGTVRGLNRFIKNKNQFIKYLKKDGLSNDEINGIIVDDSGIIWVTTNDGITRFNSETEEFTAFYESDGLLGSLFNPGAILKDNDSEIYAGSLSGINVINPDNFFVSVFNPPVYITSIIYHDKTGQEKTIVNPGKTITLPRGNNQIDIRFAALDYSNSSKIKYNYILLGYEEYTKPSFSKNNAIYTGIGPGEYVFKVLAKNGNRSIGLASIKIIIPPPFWATWIFRLFLLIAITYISFLFHEFKVKMKLKEALNLQRIKFEEINKIRKKTALDFHDDLGHSLTRISLLSEIIKNNLRQDETEVKSLFDKMMQNTKYLYEGTRDFIWSIDPNYDSLYSLLIRLKDFAEEFFSASGIIFEANGFEDELKKISVEMTNRRQIVLIFKEAMNNALRHSKATRVEFSVNTDTGSISIKLQDNGKGFDPEQLLNINGLKNMRDRAARINCELITKSKVNIGTEIILIGRFSILAGENKG